MIDTLRVTPLNIRMIPHQASFIKHCNKQTSLYIILFKNEIQDMKTSREKNCYVIHSKCHCLIIIRGSTEKCQS